MKHSDSTEMDRLLRRFARRDGEALRAAARGAGDDAAPIEARTGAHMDADEMNAYAEGALPETARSRYFAHLADCDSCRKLVTSLTLAAGVDVEGRAKGESLDAVPSKSWRDWLAAIFSPPVLRYGVPALALFAVIIVAVVMTRTRKENLSVAQNTEESRYSAQATANDSKSVTDSTTATGTVENHSTSNVAPSDERQGEKQPAVSATPSSKAGTIEGESVVSQGRVAEPEQSQTSVAKDGTGNFGAAGKREQAEAVTASAPPPPAPQPTELSATTATESGDRARSEDQKKNKTDERDDNRELPVNGRAPAGASVANKAPSAVGNTDAATSRAAKVAARRSVASPKTGPPADTLADKEVSTETRSAGGRRFQRRGAAWVDTAYNSSRALTNVARGSEQYRALVADEPGLRSIAEQLGGEVIVVWKGRAYRFH
jgi:hypothetical protein